MNVATETDQLAKLLGIALDWQHTFAVQGVMVVDTSLRIRYWNHWMAIHTGLPSSAVEGQLLLEVYPDLVTRGLDLAYGRALQGEVIVVAQRFHHYLLPMQPGNPEPPFTFMQQSAQIAPLVADGQILGIITAIEDVTERVAREDDLRESEQRYRTLSDQSPVGVYVSQHAQVRYVNSLLAAMLGYTPAELVNRDLYALIAASSRNEVRAQAQQVLAGQIPSARMELLAQRRDGTMLPAEAWGTRITIDGQPAILGTFTDISERKRSELHRAMQFAVTRILADAPSIADAFPRLLQAICQSLDWQVGEMWQLDDQNNCLRWSAGWHAPDVGFERFLLAGRELRYVCGQGLPGQVWSSGAPVWVENVVTMPRFVRATVAAAAGLRTSMAFPVSNDKSFAGVMAFFCRAVSRPQADLLATMTDIGQQVGQFIERKQIESALRKSEALLRQITDNMLDMISQITAEGVFAYVSPSHQLALGYTPEELIGRTIYEFIHPEDVPSIIMTTNLAVEQHTAASMKIRFRHAQGHYLWLEAVGNPLFDGDGHYSGAVIGTRDITERRRIEDVVRQAQKLDSLGVIVGGVAHDFNNLLTGMLSQSTVALEKLPADHPATDNIRKAITAAERAADLTRQLLVYAGKAQSKTEWLDLNHLIRENGGLLETTKTRRMEFDLNLAESLPLIAADRSQLQQVIMNLVINASEAITGDNGHVKLVTGACRVTNAEAASFVAGVVAQPGQYVFVEVSDNGIGMDQATLARIFDPFFSTKFTGRGLGLSATLGIVRAHRGGLQVWSEPGVGTTFRILFPTGVTGSEASRIGDTDAAPVPPPSASTVLVIDDEPLIREILGDMLIQSGLETLVAEDGRSGLALFQQHPERIGVVILDWVMPDMNGAETLAALRTLAPDVRVIVSSAFDEAETITPLMRRSVKRPTAYMQKPYNMKGMVALVHKVLAR